MQQTYHNKNITHAKVLELIILRTSILIKRKINGGPKNISLEYIFPNFYVKIKKKKSIF